MNNEIEHNHSKSDEDCICEQFKTIIQKQKKLKELQVRKIIEGGDTIPIMLQTPYGHPFFTIGAFGSDDCFITVFFKVIEVDCDNKCVTLQLLKPDHSIIDPYTNEVELTEICKVNHFKKTSECIKVKFNCYSAIKCLDPTLVKY